MKPRPTSRKPPRQSPPARKTHWGGVAGWYDKLVGEEGSEYHREVVFPNVLKLLAPQPAEHVLDVACGQGAFARLLHARAARVTGVDAAPELIDAARRRNDGLADPPTYSVADARKLGFLPEQSFDAATCILAIQNIDDLSAVFTGVRRALKPRGRFVLAMMHPAFRGPKYSHWGWDDQQKVQYRRIDRYLLPRKDPIFTHPGKKTGQYTWSFHRPLQAYVKAMRNADLLVDALEEWPSHKTSEPQGRGAAENTARKEIPMFLAIRCVVAPAAASD